MDGMPLWNSVGFTQLFVEPPQAANQLPADLSCMVVEILEIPKELQRVVLHILEVSKEFGWPWRGQPSNLDTCLCHSPCKKVEESLGLRHLAVVLLSRRKDHFQTLVLKILLHLANTTAANGTKDHFQTLDPTPSAIRAKQRMCAQDFYEPWQ